MRKKIHSDETGRPSLKNSNFLFVILFVNAPLCGRKDVVLLFIYFWSLNFRSGSGGSRYRGLYFER
jgi:hypothetical protein